MAEPLREMAGWLPAARAGSREALGQALEACRDYLLLVADRELAADLRAKVGASDLVQETFLEAQRDFARFHGDSPGELRAWLRRLLLNNLANCARGYRDTAKRQLGREVPFAAAGDAADGAIAATPSPTGQAMAREAAERLDRAVERLPEDYRRVIRLRHQEGRSFEEIGETLRRSPNAARMLWLRAVEQLRQEWERPA
jgi:RNA polymerase sigma-70 factor (ECF subfamily)